MKNKTVKLIVILATILIIIDQASKLLVSTLVKEPIGNEYIGISIANNTGLAFGFNEGNTKNIFIMIFVIGLIIKFIFNQIEQIDKRTAIALSMALAGGIGNLIDRIFRGAVFDFIKIYNFPVFNFADMIVILGWILIIIFLIDFSRK